MDFNPNLKKDLPANLREKLNQVLMAGETVQVSLPGAFGEGFAVTERRVLILRENISASDVDAFIYPIHSISGVDVTKTPNGGVMVIDGPTVPQEIEKHAVFFPSYEMEAFTDAGEIIKGMLSAPAAAPARTAADGGLEVDPKCGQCGAALRGSGLFCWNCGADTGFLCEVCGDHIAKDASFCTGCGAPAVPDEGKCPGCGKMMPSKQYAFCPWCGHAQGIKCFVCGVPVSKAWVHCANCGRKLGSEVIDSRSMRAAYSRAPEEEQRSVPVLDEQPVSSGEDGATSLASGHNERGKQLFEQDDIEGAIREFRTAVELEPENSAYHCNLAVALDENDEDEEALAEYLETLRLNPNDTTALLYIGYMYSENGETENAAMYWRKLIEIAPGSADAEEAKENLRHKGDL